MLSTLKKYNNKTVLVTGHTGFKGSWLVMCLLKLNAKVIGISKDIKTNPNNFDILKLKKKVEDYRFNILDLEKLKKIVIESQPDFIFHLAAQSTVSESYRDPLDTIKTNVIGSTNILESVRSLKKNIKIVMITSDKVYKNNEWEWGYRENDVLGGVDPYSASKAATELIIKSYFKSFLQNKKNLTLGVARAGNVIGGGDWSEGRIVPDCIKAWSKNKTVNIRNPNSTRPWQHVLEPIFGYLILGSKLNKKIDSEAFNFGPALDQNYSVDKLIQEMSNHWENIRWTNKNQSNKLMHEAKLLKLNCEKSLLFLNWKPILNFSDAVSLTIKWYKQFYQKNDVNMLDYSFSQIEEYLKILINGKNK